MKQQQVKKLSHHTVAAGFHNRLYLGRHSLVVEVEDISDSDTPEAGDHEPGTPGGVVLEPGTPEGGVLEPGSSEGEVAEPGTPGRRAPELGILAGGMLRGEGRR